MTYELLVCVYAQFELNNDDTAPALPAYEVVNVFAEYQPRQMKNLNIRLDVRNLFDETFSRRSSDGINLGAVIPLTDPGRTVSLSAVMKF